MNTFGKKFKFTSFGESHGVAVGCVIDGMPSGIKINEDELQSFVDKRKPGLNAYATARNESDKVQILSGIFNSYTTGTPIAAVVYNENQKSKDYENIKNIFRPAHADFTYFHKYGIRDHRGGGRSSARETLARVIAAGFANFMLRELDICVQSGVHSIGSIVSENPDFNFAENSEIYALDKEDELKNEVLRAKKDHNSVGGAVLIKAKGLPIGLGEPIYYKFDAVLAEALMGINGVKAVEIGDGISVSKYLGTQNNDLMDKNGFVTNHSGGILGGISNGDELLVKVYFKPTPSIFKEQKTLNLNNEESICNLRGRHDPCIAIRGSIVAKSMVILTIADLLLLNLSSKFDNIKQIYYKKDINS